MSLPKKIKIYGHDLKVTRKKLDDCFGTFHVDEKTGGGKICIDKNIDEAHAESVLLHEVIHACLSYSGVVEHLSEALEESIVVALQNGLGPLYERRQTKK